jgi:NAD(P)-dependent dehydrogenase (short-subunit alcohol dehydrogenase family)
MTARVVLITGASKGIGRAAAKQFAANGHITYATARRGDTFSELQALGCHTLCLDVTDERSMKGAVAEIEAQHGAVDVLVNNAGYGQLGALEELSMEALRQQFETNVFGLLRLTQLVLPGMRRKGWGRIINVSSVGGEFTAPGAGAYHMSKYAVESLTDALRYEVRGFGVDVVSIQPGGVATNFIQVGEETFGGKRTNSPYAKFNENLLRGTRQMFAENSPYGILTPEQVAARIYEAGTARRPRTRYKIGMVAKMLPRVRRMLPDRMWDSVMATQFPVE